MMKKTGNKTCSFWPPRRAALSGAIVVAGALSFWLAHANAQGQANGPVPAENKAANPTQPASFTDDVRPFFETHCVRCHGEQKPKGKLRLDTLSPEAMAGERAEDWHRVVEAIEFGEMPPPKEKQPAEEDAERIAAWIKAALTDAGNESDVDHKLRQPAYANLVNHNKLFDGSQPGPAYSPPRLWRLHPSAYDAFLEGFGRQLSDGGPLSKPFIAGTGKGEFRNYAGLEKVDGATMNQVMANARQVAEYQTTGFSRMVKDRKTKQEVEQISRKPPESFEAIMTAKGDLTDAMLDAAVAEEFALILNRAPSADEAQRFGALLRQAIEIGGPAKGLRTMAMAVMLRPEAIFRMEVGLGETDAHGRRMLSPYELAHAIAYALTDLPPDRIMLGEMIRKGQYREPSLLDLAEQGKLQTREDVRAAVTLLWEHEGVDKPRLLRFFHEFFGYHTADLVFKGSRAGKELKVDQLVQEADRLVMHHVKRDKDVLAQLLTTDKYFVLPSKSEEDYRRRIQGIRDKVKPEHPNYKYFVTWAKETGKNPMPQANPTWRNTVRFYNLEPDEWDYPIQQPFAMPAGQRKGILTHPAWLIAWSGNFDNDPIHRGKWVREHLLADTVPEIPITVDAQLPEDPHKTLRQRMAVTRDPYCYQCHEKMNPLGLPFEQYDDFGQYRTEEGLGETKALRKPKQTAPLVTTGQIVDSGDSAIDGEVADVGEMMDRLASSDRVRQSFVRHAFRYWMGRNEMLSDSPTLIAADDAYVEQGGSFKAMVIELICSDSFLYRK